MAKKPFFIPLPRSWPMVLKQALLRAVGLERLARDSVAPRTCMRFEGAVSVLSGAEKYLDFVRKHSLDRDTSQYLQVIGMNTGEEAYKLRVELIRGAVPGAHVRQDGDCFSKNCSGLVEVNVATEYGRISQPRDERF